MELRVERWEETVLGGSPGEQNQVQSGSERWQRWNIPESSMATSSSWGGRQESPDMALRATLRSLRFTLRERLGATGCL